MTTCHEKPCNPFTILLEESPKIEPTTCSPPAHRETPGLPKASHRSTFEKQLGCRLRSPEFGGVAGASFRPLPGMQLWLLLDRMLLCMYEAYMQDSISSTTNTPPYILESPCCPPLPSAVHLRYSNSAPRMCKFWVVVKIMVPFWVP